MSWHTTSYTLAVPARHANDALAQVCDAEPGHVVLVTDELVYGSGEYPPQEPGLMRYLMVESRSGRLEWNLRAYLKAFQAPGLEYFRPQEEVIQPAPWGVVLHGERLAAAIDGLTRLLAAMRADPQRCQALWDDPHAVAGGDVFDPSVFAQAWPEEPAAANEWAGTWASDTEGQDFTCVPAFFHAHCLMLKLAQAQGRAGLYAFENA